MGMKKAEEATIARLEHFEATRPDYDKLTDEFEATYPEKLSDRLQWLEENMKIPRKWMVSLMFIPDHQGWASITPWPEVCKRFKDDCCALEIAVAAALEWCRYDFKEFAGMTDEQKQTLLLMAGHTKQYLSEKLFEKHWKWDF